MALMPGRRAGGEGRGSALLPPAGNFIKGDPVGTAGEVHRGHGDNEGHGNGNHRDDAEAAEALFKAVYPKLAGWVRRLVDDDDTAHEIASEAFTRLLARWSSLDNPQSYLYMIATNLIRDHWRKVGRERRALRAVSATIPAEAVHYPAQDVDVRALIQGLPDRLRQPFLLHYYAGFPIRDVAEMLGRPEGTVKADLHHARARLRAVLGEAHG